jgi:hypothetical protein
VPSVLTQPRRAYSGFLRTDRPEEPAGIEPKEGRG